MLKTYGTLKFHKPSNEWVITNCQPHVRIKLKAIFPKIPKTAIPPYKFINTPQNCADLIWFNERFRLEITPQDSALLKKQKRKYEKVKKELDSLYSDGKPPAFNLKLRPDVEGRPHQLQNAGIHYLSKGLLVADEMGLGKTITGLLTLLYEEHLYSAIVVKTALQAQWLHQALKFTYLNVHVVKTTTPYIPPKDAQIVIFRYSQLAGWSDFFETGYFKSVIFDEIQELSTGTKSQKGKGAKILADNAIARLGLSANPLRNYGSEIYDIYLFLRPELLNSRSEFETEWLNDDGKTLKDPDALRSYLIDNHAYIRTTKAEVGQSGNNVGYQTVYLPYDETDIKQDKKIAIQLALETLKAQSRKEVNSIGFKLDATMRQMTGIAKARSVAEYVKIIVEQGQKIVLVGFHREVYSIWLEEFKNIEVAMYTGSESPKDKIDSFERFTNGDAMVFILSLQSAEGIDGLQHVCNTILIAELPWNKSKIEQSVGRLDRDGQKHFVDCLYLLTDGGSDPIILDLIARKSADTDALIKGSENVFGESDIKEAEKFKFIARKLLEKHGYTETQLDEISREILD